MRIIGGSHGGKNIPFLKNLDLRPTTDFAKEGLFNVLENRLNLEELDVLDLFSGTGSISFEFMSRGCKKIISVEKNFRSVQSINFASSKLDLKPEVIQTDVFEFLKKCTSQFSLIFADPPFELKEIEKIHELVFTNKIISDKGLLVIEHGGRTDLSMLSHFTQRRKYGNVNFSFFENKI